MDGNVGGWRTDTYNGLYILEIGTGWLTTSDGKGQERRLGGIFFSFDPKSKGDFDEGYIGAVDVNFYEPNY